MDHATVSRETRESGSFSRALEIARLVYFIQVQDMQSASGMLDRFQQRGERVSREIMSAYWHQAQSQNCSAA